MDRFALPFLRAWSAAALASGGLAPAALAADAPQAAAREWMMGTIADVRIYDAGDTHSARAGLDAALAELRAIDRLMAVQRPDSDVSRVNREGGLRPLVVDRRVIEVLHAGLEAHRLTGGAFDVTVLPAVEAWGFTGPRPHRPAADGSRAPGPVAVAIDDAAGTIRLTTPGAGIDLGGIAKGYALDRARALLRARGVRSAWMDLGGNVATLGEPPGGGRWRVAIRHPRRPDAVLGVLEVGEAGVSTSGDAERYVEDDGGRAGHIFDPRTGRPAARRVVSATVVAPSATTADALSTAAVVLGADVFVALAGRLGVGAAVGVLDRPDHIVLTTTPGLGFEAAAPQGGGI